MDELCEQVRIQGDALGEIKQMLIAKTTNNGAPAAHVAPEAAKNGENHIQDHNPNPACRYQ